MSLIDEIQHEQMLTAERLVIRNLERQGLSKPAAALLTTSVDVLATKQEKHSIAIELDEWKVQVLGERCGRTWEISVVRTSNGHAQHSWGWFGQDKLLVSHNGGPWNFPICGFVWDQQIATANELCRRLNIGEDVSA